MPSLGHQVASFLAGGASEEHRKVQDRRASLVEPFLHKAFPAHHHVVPRRAFLPVGLHKAFLGEELHMALRLEERLEDSQVVRCNPSLVAELHRAFLGVADREVLPSVVVRAS